MLEKPPRQSSVQDNQSSMYRTILKNDVQVIPYFIFALNSDASAISDG